MVWSVTLNMYANAIVCPFSFPGYPSPIIILLLKFLTQLFLLQMDLSNDTEKCMQYCQIFCKKRNDAKLLVSKI